MGKKRIALILSLFALGLTACGGDDEEDEATTIPTIPLSVPGTETTLDEEEDEATTGTVVAPPAPAPAPAPEPAPAPAPEQAPDSPENDTPPPPGSPAEQFENFCEQNPGAC